ncbi:uncharacterized protein [Aegilops tauschii subsp. strangulata]|uniref:uncharacterized protein isoform X3 n=1 Tax=Aegilops tauschii subsp. strangulata TaxID=200361 RepID=UPI001ABCF962|nr:uncharacterized protein LOC109737711 isoform X2 [Aegilops tauschii subsp. strangulata]XP_044375436.1 uncharacterized protein LOC123097689 isoform X2 [Triticum aestivum]
MIETPPLLTSSHIWVVEPTGMREEAAAAGAVLANASSSHNRRQCWRIGCPWCVNHERCRRKNHVDKSTHTHQVQVAVTVSHHPRSRCFSNIDGELAMEAHSLLILFLDWPLRGRPTQTSAGFRYILKDVLRLAPGLEVLQFTSHNFDLMSRMSIEE